MSKRFYRHVSAGSERGYCATFEEELLERAEVYYDAQYEAEMRAVRTPEGEAYYQHCLSFCLARPALSISRLTCYLCEESGDKFGGVGESLARYAAKVASALAALEA